MKPTKFIVAILLTGLLSFAIGLFTLLPWFSFMVCAFLIAVIINQKPLPSFLAAFVAGLLLWLALVLIQDIPNEHILSKRVADIFGLKGNYTIFIIITAFLGGLLSGLAALTGSFVRAKPTASPVH